MPYIDVNIRRLVHKGKVYSPDALSYLICREVISGEGWEHNVKQAIMNYWKQYGACTQTVSDILGSCTWALFELKDTHFNSITNPENITKLAKILGAFYCKYLSPYVDDLYLKNGDILSKKGHKKSEKMKKSESKKKGNKK